MDYKEYDYRIRKATNEDRKCVEEITIRAWKPIYAGYRKQMGDELFRAFYPNWQERKKQDVWRATEQDNRFLYVSELDGVVVGFCGMIVQNESRIGWIDNNAVDPDFQGRGIGKKQMEFIMKNMEHQGIRFVRVMTGLDDAHASARKMYERMGFSNAVPSVVYYLDLKRRDR